MILVSSIYNISSQRNQSAVASHQTMRIKPVHMPWIVIYSGVRVMQIIENVDCNAGMTVMIQHLAYVCNPTLIDKQTT